MIYKHGKRSRDEIIYKPFCMVFSFGFFWHIRLVRFLKSNTGVGLVVCVRGVVCVWLVWGEYELDLAVSVRRGLCSIVSDGGGVSSIWMRASYALLNPFSFLNLTLRSMIASVSSALMPSAILSTSGNVNITTSYSKVSWANSGGRSEFGSMGYAFCGSYSTLRLRRWPSWCCGVEDWWLWSRVLWRESSVCLVGEFRVVGHRVGEENAHRLGVSVNQHMKGQECMERYLRKLEKWIDDWRSDRFRHLSQ